MIESMILKRAMRRVWDLMNQDDFDVNAAISGWGDDTVWDGTSELGVGETLIGKKAMGEWLQR